MLASAHLPYGADSSGLVYGFIFSRDGVGRAINTSDALEFLNAPKAVGDFVWLHFNGAYPASHAWIERNLELPHEFYDALQEGSPSTRIEYADDHLIAVVNDVVYDLKHEASLNVASLSLCAGPNYLLSIRTQPLRSVDRLRTAVKDGESFPSPLSLLIHMMRDQADVLVQIMRNATDKANDIEDKILADRLPERAGVGGIRRDLLRLQRLLAPEPAALFRLLNRPPAWISSEDAQELRQATEEFSVVLRDMAGLQERVKVLQEEIVARISERTNRSVFVLTAVTVIALPINLTSGLFGMNVGGIPFADNSHGFWIVVFLVLVLTGIATWHVFQNKGE